MFIVLTYLKYNIMKKSTMSLFAICLLVLVGCSSDIESIEENNINPNFRVYDAIIKGEGAIEGNKGAEDPTVTCSEPITLIAGQNHDAGTVIVTTDGENLIITYSTNGDWIIGATHMSIGDCAEQEIPQTGSGNPKVGHFEHSSEHPEGTNEVVYLISLEAVSENSCFAAHAEVTGPTGGETAWAQGIEFDGNSWAMYVQMDLSECLGGEEEEVVEEE